MRLIIFLLLAIIFTAFAKPSTQDDNYSDYNEDDINANEDEGDDDPSYDDAEEERLNQIPIINTKPKHIMATEGDTVRLPCDVVDGDNFVVGWRKDSIRLFQGSISLEKSSKVNLLRNSTIEIPHVNQNDAGNYICYIMLNNTYSIDVTHHLSLKTEPKITTLETKNNITQLHEGNDLQLTCSASGNPKPEIKWYFDTKYSNSGEEQKESIFIGEKLLIENIGFERSGHYRCLADNGYGRPAHKSIYVEVIGKPSVRIEKIYTDNKLHEIVCIVYAHPDANVHWKKDNKQWHNNGESSHKIVFKNIKKSDFGEYTCIARNAFGESKATVQITAVPEKPHLSMSKCTKHKDCILEWTVHSHSPILESIISYWEKGQSHAKEVFPPKPDNSKDNIFTVSYTFSDLKRGTYEAQFKSKNEHGWSSFSNVTHFEIKGLRHPKHHSSHGDTRANNGVMDRAESHTEMKDHENTVEEEEVKLGSHTSSGVTSSFKTEILVCMAVALLWP